MKTGFLFILLSCFFCNPLFAQSYLDDNFDDSNDVFDAPFGDYNEDTLGSNIFDDSGADAALYPAPPVPEKPPAKKKSGKMVFTAAANEGGEEDSAGTLENSGSTEDQNEGGLINDAPEAKTAKPFKNSAYPDLWKGRRQQRYLEFGILGLQFGVDNSIFTFTKIIDAFDSRLYFNPQTKTVPFSFGLNVFTKPFYLKIVSPRSIDLEFFTSAEVRFYGDVGQGTMDALNKLTDIRVLGLKNPVDISNKISGAKGNIVAAASAFAELGVAASKTILDNRLWFKVTPSVFFTAFYMPHNGIELNQYGGDGADRWIGIKGEGAIDVYSSYDLETQDFSRLFSSPGFDISIEGRYALFSFLDIGAKVDSIPVFPSTTLYRSGAAINVDFRVPDPNNTHWTPEQLDEYASQGIGFASPDIGNMFQGTSEEKHLVHRPTRINLSVLYKPFNSHLLVVQPHFGMSLNSVIASYLLNYGIDFTFNLPAMFSASLGLNVFEETWRTKAAFEIDFRVFELDIGAAFQGSTFLTMYELKGLGLFLGFKFGY